MKPGSSLVLRRRSGYSRCSSLNSALSAMARFTVSPYSGRARVSTATDRCWSLVRILMVMCERRLKKSGSQRGLGTRLSSQRIPAAIRRESRSTALLLEVVARGQHPARISFAVPPLHILGSAVDELAFTRDIDSIQAHGELIAEVVGHVEVDLLVCIHEPRQSLLALPHRRRQEGITPVVRQARRQTVL